MNIWPASEPLSPAWSMALAALAAMLALVALGTTAFGLRQRRYDGWNWWTLALWHGTAAVALAATAVATTGALTTLGSLLLLPTPWLLLRGLRRFHPRQILGGSHRLDGLVLLATLMLWLLAAAVPASASELFVLAAVLMSHGHVAAVLLLGPPGRDYTPVRALALVLAVVAALPLAGWFVGVPVLLSQAIGQALLLPALAFVALALLCERTERQLRDSRRRLRVLAHLDSLTQLPNRRHFDALAEAALAQDEPGTAALLHIDVDHFKRINDIFGHAAGDRALQLVGQAMLEALRANDIPGRHGGDEFVLLLRQTSATQALGVAERITTEVQKQAPLHHLPTVSLSVGVVQVASGESVAAALRRADQAMYEAKRQGRGRAVAAEGDEAAPVFGSSRPMGLQAA